METKQEIIDNEERPKSRFWLTVLTVTFCGLGVFFVYGLQNKMGFEFFKIRPDYIYLDAILSTLFTLVLALIAALAAKLLHKEIRKPFIVAFVIIGLFVMYARWNELPTPASPIPKPKYGYNGK